MYQLSLSLYGELELAILNLYIVDSGLTVVVVSSHSNLRTGGGRDRIGHFSSSIQNTFSTRALQVVRGGGGGSLPKPRRLHHLSLFLSPHAYLPQQQHARSSLIIQRAFSSSTSHGGGGERPVSNHQPSSPSASTAPQPQATRYIPWPSEQGRPPLDRRNRGLASYAYIEQENTPIIRQRQTIHQKGGGPLVRERSQKQSSSATVGIPEEEIIIEEEEPPDPLIRLAKDLAEEGVPSPMPGTSKAPPTVPWELPPEYVEGVTVVRDRKSAERAIKALYAHPDVFFACDTEVADINVKAVGPVGNGKVICFSLYGGPNVDFGAGPGTVLWVDNLGVSEGLIQEFQGWFQDERAKQVWHNYGFDRHVLYNEGIDCRGFAGDTMHMARLWDSSRDKATANISTTTTLGRPPKSTAAAAAEAAEEEGPAGNSKGYSLEALSNDLVPQEAKSKSMKVLFGVKSIRKDGSEGSMVKIPDLRELQTNESTRAKWIQYSALDARATWALRQELEKRLKATDWEREPLSNLPLGAAVGGRGGERATMYDFYRRYFVPFGEVLTDMEREGIRVDAREYLADIQKKAEKEKQSAKDRFVTWASKYDPSMKYCNPASTAQMQTFLFGGAMDSKGKEVPKTRTFKVDILEEHRDEYEAAMMQEVDDEVTAAKGGVGIGGSANGGRGGSNFMSSSSNTSRSTNGLGTMDLKGMKVVELKALCKEYKLKVSGKKAELIARLEAEIGAAGAALGSNEGNSIAEVQGALVSCDGLDTASHKDLIDMCAGKWLSTQGTVEDLRKRYREDVNFTAELTRQHALNQEAQAKAIAEAEAKKKKPMKKWRELTIKGMGIRPEKFTAAGGPAVSATVLRKLAGTPSEGKWGSAYDSFNGGKAGEEACWALDNLCSMGSIDTMLSNFLIPLQELVDEKSRIHCSLNLNTETGRLSARRPNLQNQPALEKDQYKIREAFVSEPGNSLIVADYGQLELRLLAHITKCQSMIQAFREGGCFHSRTAVGMFDHVRKAVDDGEVLLEWDYSQGKPPAPLLKDKYGSERRKAKTLNFSIAYGKTAFGLSKDWGVTQQEAEEMLEAWYADRPEVKKWQKETIEKAHKTGRTKTLMGRYRKLPGINEKNRLFRGHAERAAINTPIQGGAADVVMMAMLKITQSEKLQKLGWKLLLQIHDEVILEGPDESREEALQEVKNCMEYPEDGYGLGKLSIKLEVDAKTAKSWYEAK